MPNATLKLLDRDQVETLIVPAHILDAVREAFVLHSERKGQSFPVIRERLSTGGVFGIKAGAIGSEHVLGFKAAGFWPSNREQGAEPHQATIVLVAPDTGRPYCIIDGNTITTLRTGAAGALGLQRLARPDSARLTVFGTGVQARIQLEYALQMLPGLEQITYLTADGQAAPDFEARFDHRCQIRHSREANDAVSASDVVITATPGKGPLFDADAVRPGTHINCVGADTRGKRELPAGLLDRAVLFVDDAVQARDIGETQWLPEATLTEIGDLLTGKSAFVRPPEALTIFDMTGLALQDLTVARQLYQHAVAAGVGHDIPWPW